MDYRNRRILGLIRPHEVLFRETRLGKHLKRVNGFAVDFNKYIVYNFHCLSRKSQAPIYGLRTKVENGLVLLYRIHES